LKDRIGLSSLYLHALNTCFIIEKEDLKMNKELMKQVAKGLVLPALGLSGAIVLTVQNFKLRSQNKVLIAKSKMQSAVIGMANTMLDGYNEALENLIEENQSLKESAVSKKKKV
jgi:hypothetical protein